MEDDVWEVANNHMQLPQQPRDRLDDAWAIDDASCSRGANCFSSNSMRNGQQLVARHRQTFLALIYSLAQPCLRLYSAHFLLFPAASSTPSLFIFAYHNLKQTANTATAKLQAAQMKLPVG